MTFLQGVQVSILAMLIVFVLLYAISLVLESFKTIFKEKEVVTPAAKQATPVKQAAPVVQAPAPVQGVSFQDLEGDEELMLAAMVATIDMAGDKDLSNYRVVSAKRL